MPITEHIDAAGRPLAQAPEQEGESRFPTPPKCPTALFAEQVYGRPSDDPDATRRRLQEQAEQLATWHLRAHDRGLAGQIEEFFGWRILSCREIPFGNSVRVDLSLERRRGPSNYEPLERPGAEDIYAALFNAHRDSGAFQRLSAARKHFLDLCERRRVLEAQTKALEAQVGVAMVTVTGDALKEVLESLEVTGGNLELDTAENDAALADAEKALDAAQRADAEEARKLVEQWWAASAPPEPPPVKERLAELLDEFFDREAKFDPRPVFDEAVKRLTGKAG